MINELKYQVRSREIVDLFTAMRNGQLVISPYFQRNLVWRDSHKRDFIETILKGMPFPQIFLARGPIDVETMTSSTCVVDGQQRLNAIREYIGGIFDVNGKKFADLDKLDKELFLKYEVAVIDFDLDAGDDKLKEVFKRLNRTFYSLSAIEKLATEYSGSEFLLVARALSGEIRKDSPQFEMELSDEDESEDIVVKENHFAHDPAISQEIWDWLLGRSDGSFSKIVASDRIFTNYEAQRKVPLMFVLNILCTYMVGYFNRNSKVREYLERFNENFEDAGFIIEDFNKVADVIIELDLPLDSMWWNKANFFTMVVELVSNGIGDLTLIDVKKSLIDFEREVPKDYVQAAREAVNNRAERLLRGRYFRERILGYPQRDQILE